MAEYFDYFFYATGQVTSVIATATIWLALFLIGRIFTGNNVINAAIPFFGWGIVTIIFTIFGVFTALGFFYITIFIGSLAVVSGIYSIIKKKPFIDSSILKIFILTTPLWLPVSAMTVSQWDEFSHWLPSALFLWEMDGFPNKLNPITGASFPAYPYAWPILIYLTSRITGNFIENAGALLNLYVLLTFGLILLEVIRRGIDRSPLHPLKGWMAIALAALLVTGMNPTFIQKIVLTAYSETSTSVTIALAGILAWILLDELSHDRHKAALVYAWQTSLVLAVHVNIRQTNLVLFLILIFAITLVALRDPNIQLIKIIKPLVVIVTAPLITYLSWRYHVESHLAGLEFVIRPVSIWNIDIIPEILYAMANVASKKGVYFLLMLVVLWFGFRGLRHIQSPLDRLAVIAGTMFIGYNAFLFFSYLTAFDQNGALGVVSYWRYNTHVGLFGCTFAAYFFAQLWRNIDVPDIWQRRLGVAAIAILLLAPLVLIKKIRFDRDARKLHYLNVARDLTSIIPHNSSYYILDPSGNGEVGVITRFRLGRGVSFKGMISGFQVNRLTQLGNLLVQSKPRYILVHSSSPEISKIFDIPLVLDRSYLFKNEENSWAEVKTWPEKIN